MFFKNIILYYSHNSKKFNWIMYCVWLNRPLKDITYLDRHHPWWIPLAKLDVLRQFVNSHPFFLLFSLLRPLSVILTFPNWSKTFSLNKPPKHSGNLTGEKAIFPFLNPDSEFPRSNNQFLNDINYSYDIEIA